MFFFSGLKSLKQQRTIKAHSKILLPSAGLVSTESHTALAETALNHMNNDEVTDNVKRDSVIKQLGSILLGKLGTQRKSDISQRMHQLGRLVIKVNENQVQKKSLTDLLDASLFDCIIKVTRDLCVPLQQESLAGGVLFGKPSLALKLGHSIKKCAQIKRGQALRAKNQSIQADSESFLALMEAEWTNLISTITLTSLKEKKFNKIELLPLTEDVKRLNSYLAKEIKKRTRSQSYRIFRFLEGSGRSGVVRSNCVQ